jgi:Domain of unknown function (DUF5666)
MRVRFISNLALFIIVAGLISGVVWAHGDKKHVVGTVTKVSADSVTVKTAAAASVEVKLTSSTIYTIKANMVDKPAKLADLAVGDHVVIHATPAGDTLEADDVKFSHPPQGAPTAASKPKS